jgi:hypothetical protein
VKNLLVRRGAGFEFEPCISLLRTATYNNVTRFTKLKSLEQWVMGKAARQTLSPNFSPKKLTARLQ